MKYSRLSTTKLNKIFLCLAEDITATAAAKIIGVNRNTINNYFFEIRKLIFEESLLNIKKELGEPLCDESYFGAKRLRGKRGRGAVGKTPVFGLKKRDGKVFVVPVPECSKDELMPIIKGLVLENSAINTDGWKAYDGLILNGYEHHRVYHSNNEFARGKCHVNGIENFWGYAKNRMHKFHGIDGNNFIFHLKECEFRYNNRNENLTKVIKKLWEKHKKN